MPLMNVGEMLRNAEKNGKCVAAVIGYNYETLRDIVQAAKEMESPVILMHYPPNTKYISLSMFLRIAEALADDSPYPVGIHLDHSHDPEFIQKAVDAGFRSVIVDASALPYEENAALTRRIVDMVKPYGASVEAELGYVGFGVNTGDYENAAAYTNPDEARRFALETGIDSLAVAVGNAHGAYATTPHINMEVLKNIHEKTPVPLVLHGGSGIPDDQLAQAVTLGIRKLNFGTYYYQAAFDGMAKFVREHPSGSHMEAMDESGEASRAFVRDRIRVLDSLTSKTAR